MKFRINALFGLIIIAIFIAAFFLQPAKEILAARSCTDAAATAVRLSIPKASVYVGEKITFNITGDASTYITDTFNSGGVTCPAFPDGNHIWEWFGTVPKTSATITCDAVTPGTYNWVHKWKACEGLKDGIPQNCTPDYCTAAPGSVPYTILATTTATPTPSPVPEAVTTHYRCIDIPFSKDDTGSSSPVWKDYLNSDLTGDPIKFSYTFTNNVVSDKDLTIYCQFKDNTGRLSQVYPKSIKYIGGDPKIKSISCGYDPSGVGTTFTILGENFGAHSDQGDGNVKAAGKETTISYWAEEVTGSAFLMPKKQGISFWQIPEVYAQGVGTESAEPTLPMEATPTATIAPTITSGVTPTSAPTPTVITTPPPESTPSPTLAKEKNILYKVIAKLKEKLPEGRYPVVLTTDDGRSVSGYCRIGLTTVEFTVINQCGMPPDLKEATVSITEKVDKAKSLYKKKIKLDKTGSPTDFTPALEIGKEYTLTIKTDNALSRRINFTAEEGTTELGKVLLLTGDIYGQGGQPDNVVNAVDKSELSREWSLVTDVTRTGDLNGDSRVNSVDYACMRQNIGKSGE